MIGLETNVFPITNLGDLSARYVLYHVRGLRAAHPEYHQNRQTLIRKLSFQLKSPVTIVQRNGEPYLVVRDDTVIPESPYPLVRAAVYFDPAPGRFTLDFAASSPETDEIRLRFLSFLLQAPLRVRPRLWQPSPGEPFFEREFIHESGNVCQHRGYAVRPVLLSSGGIGLCVDVKHRYICKNPLPVRLTRDDFRRWRWRRCVYRFGHQWYEVQLQEWSNLTVNEEQVENDGRRLSLLEYLHERSAKPIPPDLRDLPTSATVVYYLNNQNQSRSAPAALCYPVVSTQEAKARHQHKRTILPPYERRALIHSFVREYLLTLEFGDATLRVSPTPWEPKSQPVAVPDLRFGGGEVLSVRSTPGTRHVGLDRLGEARLALLRDKSAGFYVHDPLPRQYLFMPQTVWDSSGPKFVADLAREVNTFFPQEAGYQPTVVTYNDRVRRTWVEQGRAILHALEKVTIPGYGVVMIHHTEDRRNRHEEDPLAAMVTRELRLRHDLATSVIHSRMCLECYVAATDEQGRTCYVPRAAMKGKLDGYLRNVALNKVLLTSERWPFVLATALHADLTIGIDVKNNTAGFTVVSRLGDRVRTVCTTSRQREMLLADQVCAYLIDLIRLEAQDEPIRRIVVHRDGRVWPDELAGIRRAVETLRKEAVLPEDATVAVLELAKTSPAPLRLFDVFQSRDHPRVENPQVGAVYCEGDTDAYLCTTGRAFRRPGTTNPLHVRYVEGSLPFRHCLEDLFSLSCLAWSRPDDCARDPITIKLTDRRLSEDAGDYDADALEYVVTKEEDAA